MKRSSVVLSGPAISDLNGIVEYISVERQEAVHANNLVAKLKEAIMQLVVLPKRHPLGSDEYLARQGIRMLVVDSYLVFYRLSEGEAVTLIRILHSRRNWQIFL